VCAERREGGYSLIEVVFACGLIVTLAGVAIPQMLASIDAMRTAGAARYVSARLQRARMEAVARSTSVAMRFKTDGSGYTYAAYIDGNRNGVLTHDIQSGVDRQITVIEHLGDSFAGVEFGTVPDLPPVDPGGAPPGDDPIRIGASDLATFTPHGTSTTGILYIRGRRGDQYVVRIFGDTGKTRVLKFDVRSGKWKPL
jgi:type II secretory pathway pseudopilin PulG